MKNWIEIAKSTYALRMPTGVIVRHRNHHVSLGKGDVSISESMCFVPFHGNSEDYPGNNEGQRWVDFWNDEIQPGTKVD